MAFVIGTAPDALFSVEYQQTRSANHWSHGFRKIVKVRYNCKVESHSKISVYVTYFDAKCAADEIVECENEISFRDATRSGIFSIKKPDINQLKIFEMKFEETEMRETDKGSDFFCKKIK